MSDFLLPPDLGDELVAMRRKLEDLERPPFAYFARIDLPFTPADPLVLAPGATWQLPLDEWIGVHSGPTRAVEYFAVATCRLNLTPPGASGASMTVSRDGPGLSGAVSAAQWESTIDTTKGTSSVPEVSGSNGSDTPSFLVEPRFTDPGVTTWGLNFAAINGATATFTKATLIVRTVAA